MGTAAMLAEQAVSAPIVTGLVVPLCRLLAVMALSLIIAQALETFGWTAHIARIAAPLVRLAHLSPVSGAAFSLSFASPSAANATLAEGLAGGAISRRELVVANVVNSTPAFLVHLPSMLATAYSFLGFPAFAYIGIVFAAALVRTCGAVLAGRFLLAAPVAGSTPPRENPRGGTLASMFARFKKRLLTLCFFTIPIYCAVFFLQRAGVFTMVEHALAARVGAFSFIHPASVGIAVLFVAAESGAAFAGAAALIHGGTVLPEEAVLALLIGNILSSPMRAFRHQLPSYAGFFSPSTALLLIGVNQTLRAVTLALATVAFYAWAV
ncbi:MAG: hypothetical protein LIP28_08105 [Deltaproteobacteria bacterium]|nr:hypothetical protein [Deltaproteobacteria bacterium]